MVTAYDYNQAVLTDKSPVDMILVGDSVGMVALGHQTTVPVTIDDIIHHSKAVTCGASRPLVVADMPFGSYEGGPADALRSALRLMKEGGASAVKLEGGAEVEGTIRALTAAGIPVVGHVGLLPQRVNASGYAYVGGSTGEAQRLLDDSKALEDAGCFAIVLECVPEEVAGLVTSKLNVPTIGIGAGRQTSGQVLVWHDMFGLFDSRPTFAKKYADLGEVISRQLQQYHEDVACGAFPEDSHCRKVKDTSILTGLDLVVPATSAEASPNNTAAPVTPTSALPQNVLVLGSGAMAMAVAGEIAKGARDASCGIRVGMLDPWYDQQIASMQANGGLCLRSPTGSVDTVPVIPCKDTSELHERLGKADLVIVLTKSYQLQLEPEKVCFEDLVAPNGVVLSLQNGAGNKELLQKLCSTPVLLGTTSHGAKSDGLGTVHHNGTGPTFVVARTQEQRKAAEGAAGILQLAGMDASVTDSEDVILEKVIINAAINPISALLNVTNGKLLASPDVMDEVIRCVVKEGVRVLPNLTSGVAQEEKVRELVRKVRQVATKTSQNRSSMLSDITRGPNTEIDSINGFLIKENELQGFDAPVNSLLMALVKAKAQQHREP